MKTRRILVVGIIVIGCGTFVVALLPRLFASYVGMQFPGGIRLDGFPTKLGGNFWFTHMRVDLGEETLPTEDSPLLIMNLGGVDYTLAEIGVDDLLKMGATRDADFTERWIYSVKDSQGDDDLCRLQFTVRNERLTFFYIRRHFADSRCKIMFRRRGSDEEFTIPCFERDARAFWGKPLKTTYFTRG